MSKRTVVGVVLLMLVLIVVFVAGGVAFRQEPEIVERILKQTVEVEVEKIVEQTVIVELDKIAKEAIEMLKDESTTEYTGPARTAILVGFGWQNPDGTWGGEARPYMMSIPESPEKLEDIEEVTDQAPLCRGPIFRGTLSGEPVLFVVAGTAKVQMATCVQNLLQGFPGEIDEIAVTAIAGISAMRGGLVDREGNFRQDDVAGPGDMCISYFAVDFDRQYFDTDKPGIDAWWVGSRGARVSPLGSKEFADELIWASRQVDWPAVPAAPAANIAKYYDEQRRARAWGYWESTENTDDLFWHGATGDLRARVLTAEAIRRVLGTDATEEDVVICTTMEAWPLLDVVSKWNAAYDDDIRAAYIRGASNFDHPWLNDDGTAAVSGRESIEKGMHTGGGVDYSAVTEALPMLKLLELRSQGIEYAPREFVVGAILVGPYNDHGWSEAHYTALKKVEAEIPGVKVVYLDKVNPADRSGFTLEQAVDELVAQGAQLIITTSDDFQTETDLVAGKYPKVTFIMISGDHAKTGTAPLNVSNYMGKMEYEKAAGGCAAALETETGVIGYIGPLINDETRRLVAAAYLGARHCYTGEEPLRFIIKWIGFWFNIPGVTLDPTEVSHDLINEGADVIMSGIDTTEALVVAKQRGKYAVAYDYQGACDEGFDDTCLGVPYFDWAPGYRRIVYRVRDHSWRQEWRWAGPDVGAVGFEYGPALSEDAREVVEGLRADLMAGKVHVFQGPLNYQDGSVYLRDGEIATDDQVWYLGQLLEGMEGSSE